MNRLERWGASRCGRFDWPGDAGVILSREIPVRQPGLLVGVA